MSGKGDNIMYKVSWTTEYNNVPWDILHNTLSKFVLHNELAQGTSVLNFVPAPVRLILLIHVSYELYGSLDPFAA